MSYEIIIGDCREQLANLPEQHFQCCVTSPPYFGLRSYLPGEHPDKAKEVGSEATPDEFVNAMRAVFGGKDNPVGVWRVLRDDGVLWVNLGDSYNSCDKWGGGGNVGKNTVAADGSVPSWAVREKRDKMPGLKPKDLIGIPWRVAFALQADGWYLRDAVIWHKPAPMPGSQRDRCTSSYEFIFQFTKSARYYFDLEAVKEPVTLSSASRLMQDVASQAGSDRANGGAKTNGAMKAVGGETRTPRNVWRIPHEGFNEAHFATYPRELPTRCIKASTSEKGCCPECGAPWSRVLDRDRKATRPGKSNTSDETGRANRDERRHVTTTTTTGWEPTCKCDGIDRRIVMTPTGERTGSDPSLETGRGGMNRPRGDNEGRDEMTRHEQAMYAKQIRNSPHRKAMERESGKETFAHYVRTDDSGARPPRRELLLRWIANGWISHVEVPESTPLDPVPCRVLDPFNGAGTTGIAANVLGRDYTGIELNEEYAEMARRRIEREMHPSTFVDETKEVEAPLFGV